MPTRGSPTAACCRCCPRQHAYAVDQRGHGDSEHPDCCYTVDDFAADAVAVTHPERVATLVLIGSPVSLVGNQGVLEFQAAVHALQDPVPADFVRGFQAAAAHVPLPEAFLERLVAESRKLPARVWRDALDGLVAFDDTRGLGRIAAPTLLLWGERDALVSRQEQERLAAAIPDARLLSYPETGHSPHWERPERVAVSLHAHIQDR